MMEGSIDNNTDLKQWWWTQGDYAKLMIKDVKKQGEQYC